MIARGDVQAGTRVLITDYDRVEHLVEAASGVEDRYEGKRKLHDFPVVWVRRPLLECL